MATIPFMEAAPSIERSDLTDPKSMLVEESGGRGDAAHCGVTPEDTNVRDACGEPTEEPVVEQFERPKLDSRGDPRRELPAASFGALAEGRPDVLHEATLHETRDCWTVVSFNIPESFSCKNLLCISSSSLRVSFPFALGTPPMGASPEQETRSTGVPPPLLRASLLISRSAPQERLLGDFKRQSRENPGRDRLVFIWWWPEDQ